jgi:uncharacterized lipoprotein YmbA
MNVFSTLSHDAKRSRRSAALPGGPAPRRSPAFCVLTSAVCLLVAACSLPLPQAQADPTKFYVLSAPAHPAVAPAANAPALRLRPVELPTYLKSQEIVVRNGENEVEFREFARWGEPLDQGIARVLREELLNRGAASAVQSGVLRPSEMTDVKYALNVRVLAAEGDADGSVRFEAAWELYSTGDNPAAVARGDYYGKELRWTPRHEASLAAALSRAVDGLASDIAANLPKG